MKQERIQVVGESIIAENYGNDLASQPLNSVNQPVHNINERFSVRNSYAVTTPGDLSPEQAWLESRVTGIERQLLLNNCASTAAERPMSNNTKVFICSLAVVVPLLGQLLGIITGLVMAANGKDLDRKSYGAALLTVSIIILLLELVLGLLGKWFLDGLIV